MPRAPHDRDGSHWICCGALTRSVLDAAVVLDVIADSTPRAFSEAVQTTPRRLRIALSDAFPAGTQGRLDDEVRDALYSTADLLRSLGHDVVETDIDMRVRDVSVIVGLMFRGIHDFVDEIERPGRLERRTAERVGRLFRRPRRAADARHVAARGHCRDDGGLRRDRDVSLGDQLGAVHRPLELHWAARGFHPSRLLSDRSPLAVQLIGSPNDEATLLALAAQVEEARPWADHRPPVS